ncbi:hypothetical protein Tco_0072907 [Tanacetum coccineum]
MKLMRTNQDLNLIKENEKDIRDDKEEVKDEFVKTPSNDSDDEDEEKIIDKAEGDEDEYEEMDYTTSQLYDDVDIRLNEPVDTDKGFIQEEDIPHTDADIVSPMDVHIHHEVPNHQTPTLLTLPVSVITDSSPVYSTIIPQSLPSFTPLPQKLTSIPPPITEAINPQSTLLDFTPDDPLKTQVTTLVDEHLDARLGAIRDEFMNHLSASITARITEQVKIQLPRILPKEVSNFAPPKIPTPSGLLSSLEQHFQQESSHPQSHMRLMLLKPHHYGNLENANKGTKH